MRFILSLLLLAALAVPATAAANPPGNDHRQNAWTLNNGDSGTTVDATRQDDIMIEGYRPGKGAHSVWYTWTAPTAGRLSITVNAPSFDSVVAAYTTWQDFNNGDVVSDADTGAGDTASHIEIDAKAGQTFHIVVDGVTAAAAGAYSFATSWDTTPPAPANDNFANAAALTPAANPITDWTDFSHRYATKEAGEPMHRTQGTPNKSVWFKWTAPYNGYARVTADCGEADLGSTNTTVAVYTGASVGSLTEVPYESAQAAGSCTFTQVRFKVIAGVTFRIAVDNASADTGLSGVRLDFDNVAPKVSFPADTVFGPAKSVWWSSDEGYYEGVDYTCKLDAEVAKSCGSAMTVGGLSEGAHTLLVRATDDMGNSGPWATKTFTVDKTPPQTTFTSGPAAVVAASAGQQFTFTSSEAGSTFKCQAVGPGDSQKACTSPYDAIPGLSPAKFTTRVVAIDAAGNVDPTPAEWAWEVNPVKANAQPPTPSTPVVTTPKPTPTTTTPPTSTTSTRSTTTPWAPIVPPRLLVRSSSVKRSALVKKGLQVAVRCDPRVGCNAVVKLRLGRRVLGRLYFGGHTRPGWHTLTLTKSGAKALRRSKAKKLVLAIGDRAESPVTVRIR
jgi:hypothetical protein